MPATVTSPPPHYTIIGKISDKFNVPMSGFIVEVFDKRLRSEIAQWPRHSVGLYRYQLFLYISITTIW